MDSAGGDVARYKVAVLRIPLFQEVPALALRNGFEIALVTRCFRYPDASAFSACRLRHQAQLIFARNARGMNLNKLAVGVVASLLIKRRLSGTSADDGIRGPAENGAVAACGQDDSVGRKGADFHGPQVHGTDAAADVAGIEHGGKKFPVLELLHLAFRFVSSHLLVERVKQLLPGGGAGERGAVVERAAEAAKIEKSLRRAVKGHAHA